MRVRYSVSFEFPERPPVTHRGTVEAGQAHVCCSRAVKEAKKALHPINWSSVVCVLLERLDAEEETDEVSGLGEPRLHDATGVAQQVGVDELEAPLKDADA